MLACGPLVTAIATSLNDYVIKRQTISDRQLIVIRLHIDTLYVLLAPKEIQLRPETEGELIASFKILTARYA